MCLGDIWIENGPARRYLCFTIASQEAYLELGLTFFDLDPPAPSSGETVRFPSLLTGPKTIRYYIELSPERGPPFHLLLLSDESFPLITLGVITADIPRRVLSP